MSASLVGSEMCIRDRNSATRSALHGDRRHAPEPLAKLAGPAPACGGRGTCLLYTSDAADDM
eukprot:4557523-Alexandrium_andersonii.AAC.1